MSRVLAGGTDILVQLRAGLYEVDCLLDVKRVPELNELSYSAAEGLTIGAAVPNCLIYEDQDVIRHYPGIVDAAALVGGIAVQGRATIGGNVCNSTPSADTIPALIVHHTQCVIQGPGGRRVVPVEEFCTGVRRNVLEPGELLVAFKIPTPKPHFGANYLRFIPRNEMDIAVVGVGASVVLDAGGQRIQEARIALASVAPVPVFARRAGEALVGKEANEASITEAGEIAKTEASPISDMRGTAEQRTHLIGVLTRRALRAAVERTREAK